MLLLDRLRIFVIGLALSLGAACILLPWAINSMQDMIERTLVHDVAWSGANGRDDFSNLMRHAMTLNARPTEENLAATGLALDIFAARIDTWKSGAFKEFVVLDGRRGVWLAQIEDAAAAARELITRRSPEYWTRLLVEKLERVDGRVQSLTRAAYTQSVQDRDDNRQSLQRVQMIQQVLIVSLIVTGFVFVGLLSWQNVALKRSNAAQQRIAADNAFLAAHDVLTGLANRSALTHYLDELAARPVALELHAVLLIDLDGFKSINDVLGHGSGDLLLISVANRLKALAETMQGALVARLGGDEFLLIVAGVADADAAIRIGQSALEAVRKSCVLGAHTVSVDGSVGVAVASAEATPTEDLIGHADIALGTAKTLGKGRVTLFDPSMLDQIAARRKLEADLATADYWNEFEPHFQPIVELASRKVVAFEALARWRQPDGTLISPADFIPVAESSGKIIEIGRVMLFKACQAAAAYPEPVVVSVNLSAVQIIKLDIPALIAEVLAATRLPPDRLKLEITESVFIRDTRNVIQLIDTLKAMGVTLALDDFGTGYSSLSYLRTLGFDELKIDRSFVSEIGANRRSLAVTHTIVQLARTLDMTTVAEGIETEEQATMLAAMGCRCGQGYHFGKPAPMRDIRTAYYRHKPGLQVA